MKEGEWSELFDWTPDGLNKFSISGVGTYSISPRLFDENGYYMDSNSMTLVIKSKPSSDDNNDSRKDEDYATNDDSLVEVTFTDVTKDAWYYEAVSYLSSRGIIKGIGNNLYAPESLITRQDMAVILYRILDKVGELPTNRDGLTLEDFEDREDISDYAISALKLFVENKILSGYGNKLNPKGMSTRAQAAQILYNLLK